MKVKIPEGLELDAEVGGTTELLAKFKLTEDGMLELQTLDGFVVTAEEDEVEDLEEGMEDAELEGLLAGISEEETESEIPSESEYFDSLRSRNA